jgi:hypothetical protein
VSSLVVEALAPDKNPVTVKINYNNNKIIIIKC